jgi:HlyD family secretion protein
VVSAHAEAAASLREAEAQLALLLAGSRPEDIRVARDQVEIAKGRLAFQQAELKRQENLLQNNVATVSEIDKARAEHHTAKNLLESAEEDLARILGGARLEEVEEARARVESARANLDHAERQLQLIKLVAPISGRVVTPNLDARSGQVAEVGDLIAVILDTAHLRLEIAADETAAPLVKPGMSVKARLRGLDGSAITATVRSVSSAASNAAEFRVDAVRTDREVLFERSLESPADDSFHFRVYADLDDPGVEEDKLLPGMTGYARIMVGEDVFWRAVIRPFARYFLTDVWSWLP